MKIQKGDLFINPYLGKIEVLHKIVIDDNYPRYIIKHEYHIKHRNISEVHEELLELESKKLEKKLK